MVKNNSPYKTYFLEKYLTDHSINTAEVKNIVEIGAKDCAESLSFAAMFPNAHITAFECNPKLISLCKFNSGMSDRITVVGKMVTDKPENTTFYMPDGEPGMGSMKECLLPGSSVSVETVRMDDYLGDEEIDLLWIDVQGAELDVLNSFGSKLKNVKRIYCEMNLLPMRYYDSSSPSEITDKLMDFKIDETYLISKNEVHIILTKMSEAY
jgi:FkbM family methyltransferase